MYSGDHAPLEYIALHSIVLQCRARDDREQGQCTPPHLEVDAELEKEDTRRPRIKTPPSKQGRDILLCTPPTLASLRMRNC